MKRKLISVTAFFAVIIIAAAAVLYLRGQQVNSEDTKAEQIIALNEIEQLANQGDYEKMSEKADVLRENMRSAQNVSGGGTEFVVMCAICFIFLAAIFVYVYLAILRPFDKMKQFAEKIAQGNFDVPLNYERSNYFGEFTWAFDSMRREITKARSCEREAIENNKTVIATLSHDIKTPIASLRAYAEGLEANLDGTPEKRRKYLEVIMKKCDEVSTLTNDLFLHSLSDLDKLKINSEVFEVCEFIENAVGEIAVCEAATGEFSVGKMSAEDAAGGQKDIHFAKPAFTALVSADRNRLLQITENLINNARKYAKSDIEVFITKSDGFVEIHFRDYGNGIPDEDIPFIFDKFYRGKNCGSEQGSGLGLYIVKYIAEQMNGKVRLHNLTNGLEVVVELPIESDD